jgi:hypothetical protein
MEEYLSNPFDAASSVVSGMTGRDGEDSVVSVVGGDSIEKGDAATPEK